MAIFSRKPRSKVRTVQTFSPHAVTTPSGSDNQRNARIFEAGEHMLDLANQHKTGLLSARFYSDKLMDWSMQDHAFKVQLFRFVDAFPMLRTPELVHDHLLDYLTQPGVKAPPGLDLGLRASGIAKGLAAKTISGRIEAMAKQFIAGTDAASALSNLQRLWKDGIAFSVDLLGEACVSDAEADLYRDKYLDLVNNLPEKVSSWKPDPRLETDHLGPIPRTNVSIKISSLSARCHPVDTEGAIQDLMTRIVPILEAARDKGVFVNFDMEQFALKDLTLELFERCCQKIDFHAGLAMQAYLKSGVEDARRVCQWAQRTGRRVTVRLVKGAYWDSETIHAEEMGWPCPVWNKKCQTDACFERMAEVFLDACPKDPSDGGVCLALGSHNVRSIAAALVGLEERNLPVNAIELQMLHGMADQLKYAGAQMDLRVREYIPVGEMIPGMAYLVRRLLENTSNESWLKAGFLDNADPQVLLADPAREEPVAPDLYELAATRHELSRAVAELGDSKPFINEPMRDFSQESVRKAFASAVAKARVPEIANDRTPEHALVMVDKADAAFDAWRDETPLNRAQMICKAADLMRNRRDELSGVLIKESGKTWAEADADVCEAIDFCEYYARCAMPLFTRERLGRFIGELDELWYQPRGVAVVISPWNFPLAIACGMAVAALVTGNTVILKPAEQTPGIASILADILHNAGVPGDVLQLCPGLGETTGAFLVREPRVGLIAFTGSKAVGLDIINAAGGTLPEQSHVKKVVCEMGGKNAIIIDISADLDEAVLGVRHSAFAFQGQKCSACSRVIVVDPEGPDGKTTQTFLTRFVEATRSLVVGDPALPGSDMGPVIDDDSAAKIRSMIQIAKDEGNTLALGMDAGLVESQEVKPRNYIGPCIFTGVKPSDTIATQEIFGPVVAVIHARDFDEALMIANSVPYKLTGGVYSRKPAHIEKAKRQFRVGNLYINRSCTGALVARQPFGGFGMSGVGSKAGGADYLLQFVEPRVSSENTMRRGFAPEL